MIRINVNYMLCVRNCIRNLGISAQACVLEVLSPLLDILAPGISSYIVLKLIACPDIRPVNIHLLTPMVGGLNLQLV